MTSRDDIIEELFRLGEKMADYLEHDKHPGYELADEWQEACTRFKLYRRGNQ